ncbi:hypothetical protein JW935_15290 [candidate division KSB1 bacterium]|nr:hypothetical protein [candidate division KSB1 bacterium]
MSKDVPYIKKQKISRKFKVTGAFLLAILVLYLILLIPDSPPRIIPPVRGSEFAWNQDSLWYALEEQFVIYRKMDHSQVAGATDASLLATEKALGKIKKENLPPDSPLFHQLETALFKTAPLVGAHLNRLNDFLNLSSDIRNTVKEQSRHWDIKDRLSRQTLYRLLYGSRAAVEEVMLQAPQKDIPQFIAGYPEPSQTPSATMRGVQIHSGDILVSRGGAPTSAFIARGNDFPGNFSHVALVHVEKNTHRVSIVEALIERGVIVSTMEEYLQNTKLRIMVLRLRTNGTTPAIDPMLPHKAATRALETAKKSHIPYDFEMNYQDQSKYFCAEVASTAYKEFGIKLWMGMTNISSAGTIRWLSYVGTRYFETQEPSDLEYDPQLTVVAEWRDPKTLFKDHIDNAVIEVMLDYADAGKELDYDIFKLPVARIVKFYSSLLNKFGKIGPIPEGMRASSALRIKGLSKDHEAIKSRVEAMAKEFKTVNHYTAPYWQLIKFAREAAEELNY